MDLTALELQHSTSWTDQIPCLYGAYNWLNGRPLHYFNTNISIRDLHTTVRLMSQIEGIEKWGFEALFQRSISWARVEEIVTRYLKSPSRFKFFPPVTLALLPVSNGRLDCDYPHPTPTSERNGPYEVWGMPGLEIRFFLPNDGVRSESKQIAMLKWDTSRFSAVAIDGQHRIAALKHYRDSSHPEAAHSDVPATFLVFDPRLPADKHLLNLVREIFVDVNHNAKSVDESRIILLDDRNFIRRATRSCVLQAFNDRSEPTPLEWRPLQKSSATKYLDGIPQELIDLNQGKQGADVTRLKPWQYLSLFNVHRILKYFVFEAKWEEFESSMGLQDLRAEDGAVGSAVAAKRPNEEDADDASGDEDMFVFSPAVGEELVTSYFDVNVRPVIAGVLTGFKPYRTMVENAMALFSGEHGSILREYLIAESVAEKQDGSVLADNLRRSNPDLLAALHAMQRRLVRPTRKSSTEATPWQADLVWYSVTQRALFSELPMVRKAIEFFSDIGDPRTIPNFVDRYVRTLSLLWESGVFEKDFRPVGAMPLWFGSPLESKSGDIVISPSDAAAKRMARLIRILVAAVWARQNGWSTAAFFEHGFGGNSAGLKAAFTSLKKNYEKYLRNDDVSRGEKPKRDAYYSDSAERRLRNLVRETVFKVGAVEQSVEPEDDGKI